MPQRRRARRDVHAPVSGVPVPGQTSQLDSERRAAALPGRESLLDSIGPWSWRRDRARASKRSHRVWSCSSGGSRSSRPSFASAVGPLRRRGTRVVLVCDNLVPHEHRPFDGAFTRWMLRNSDGYLVMSDSVERDLDRLKPGAPRRRVRASALRPVRPRAVDARDRARAPRAVEGDVALFFGYVRRLQGTRHAARGVARACARARAGDAGRGGRVLRGRRRRIVRSPQAAGGEPRVRLLERYIPDERGRGRVQGGRRRRAAVSIGDPERRDPRRLRARRAGDRPPTSAAWRRRCSPGETGLVVPPEDPAALAAGDRRVLRATGSGRALRAGVARATARALVGCAGQRDRISSADARSRRREGGDERDRGGGRGAPARAGRPQRSRCLRCSRTCSPAAVASSGSDELAMLELSRAMVHGGIAVPEGATTAGPDGRNYTQERRRAGGAGAAARRRRRAGGAGRARARSRDARGALRRARSSTPLSPRSCSPCSTPARASSARRCARRCSRR